MKGILENTNSYLFRLHLIIFNLFKRNKKEMRNFEFSFF